MRTWVMSLTVCVLAGVVLGCLEFDQQTVYVEHDEANDRLILIFNYMGLFAAEDDNHSKPPSAGDLDESKEQLAEALELHKFAVLDTWPLATSVPEVREGLAEPDDDHIGIFAGDMPTDADAAFGMQAAFALP